MLLKLSYDYRTLGLGYANLGSMLMVAGIPYDSDKARAIGGAITAIMTGTFLMQLLLKWRKSLGYFQEICKRTKSICSGLCVTTAMLPIITDAYEGLEIAPPGIDPNSALIIYYQRPAIHGIKLLNLVRNTDIVMLKPQLLHLQEQSVW
jgi:hypothetical protein